MSARFRFCILALGALPAACNLFRKARDTAATGASSSAPEIMLAPAGMSPPDALAWKPLDDSSFIGLPQGCVLRKGARHAALPAGSVRFVSPALGSELVLAVDVDGNDTVERAGVFGATGVVGDAFPWTTLSAPPVIARSSSGFLAFRAADSGDGKRSVLLWAPPGRLQTLLDGDRLDVVDASCDGSTCAVLTSLASESAGPGATLVVGDPAAPASKWKRTDFGGEEQAWTPFSIVRFRGGVVSVALSGKTAIGIWDVKAGAASRSATIETPLGAYDVLAAEVPVAVSPGERVDGECAKDGFPMKLVRADGQSSEIDGHVPPEAVVAREIDGGFVVGWLSPTRCKLRSRQMVRAFLVGPDGSPRSSTMAVAEANGFALSTHGADIDLWLARQSDLVWVKGSCRVP